MSDRTSLRRIVDLAAALLLLVGAAAGVVYAVAIATTLQELRTLEPITLDGHPDLEMWRCPTVVGLPGSSPASEVESKPRSTGAVHTPTGAERSASCASAARQARPQ